MVITQISKKDILKLIGKGNTDLIKDLYFFDRVNSNVNALVVGKINNCYGTKSLKDMPVSFFMTCPDQFIKIEEEPC